MAGSLVNLSLLITSETGLSNALQGVIANGLTLTSYTDGTGVPTLSNRTGEIAGALYRVEGGDMAVDVTGVSGDGTYYIYINPSLLTAYADDTEPTWRGDLGGFYLASDSNVKAFFRFVKSSTNYNNRTDLLQTVGYVPSSINANVTGNLTGNVTGNLTGLITDARGMFHSNYIASSTNTLTIYNIISPYLPNVNDEIIMSGCLVENNGTQYNLIISSALRISSTEIRLNGVLFNNSFAVFSDPYKVASYYSADVERIAIAW